MTSTIIILSIYCALILLASLAGGLIPILIKLTHKRMELAVSFVAGVMLGVGVLHMLPHAVLAKVAALPHSHDAHDMIHTTITPVMVWVIIGFLAMFLIARFFRFHHHDAPAQSHDQDSQPCEHDHDHQHHHHHHTHGMTWAGAAIGLSLHSLIEGIALASSVAVVSAAADGEHSVHAAMAGLATFMVIFLHKPFDAMTIATLMSMNKRSVAVRHGVNLAFSLLVPVGVLLFYLGLSGADRGVIASSALAFSAGTFLCISMSDLLPELQFHQHDRVKLSSALLLGLALAWGMSELESRTHVHSHSDEPANGANPLHSPEHDHEDCDDPTHHHHAAVIAMWPDHTMMPLKLEYVRCG